jgi:hypothetical protein
MLGKPSAKHTPAGGTYIKKLREGINITDFKDLS